MNSLGVLKQHQQALLLAEVAALLHDVGKLSSQFVDQMSSQPTELFKDFEHESAVEQILGFVPAHFLNALRNQDLRDRLRWPQIPNNEQIGQLLDLIAHHDKSKHSAFLVRLLNRCDGADSGADKGTTRQGGLPRETKQDSNSTQIATAFGNELQMAVPALDNTRLDLLQRIAINIANITATRNNTLNEVESVYRSGLAETRRAANDVTLWDHSFSVATLYKTSLATYLSTPAAFNIDALHWRLLRVNFDVLGLYAKAVKIADLLGSQRVVDEACERVKRLIEEEYPLGNEIYRDTTGIYFTFPDLDLPADLEQEIRRRVEEAEPELAPRIAVTQGDGATATEQLKGILAKARCEALQALAQPFDDQNLSTCWQQQWETVGPGNGELCPVCRLRPMEEGREACEHCLNRRGSRIAEWLDNPHRTIWMDEIADHNDRVTLLVGKFGLDDWLSGDLVQTMLVKADQNNPTGCTPKNPSPARLRRVWDTCQRFWTETVEQEILGKQEYGKDTERANLRCIRRLVVPDRENGWKEGVPYDGSVNGKPISLFWLKHQKRFVTIINLQLTGELQQGQTVTVSDPDDSRKKITFTAQAVEEPKNEMGHSTPFLPLLASPDQFLVFVPAADALEIADKIRQKYTRQFGKVQNRLPLFLGLVFFPRKTPLLAVMDTARRMLDVPIKEEEWTVECCCLDEKGLMQHIRISQGEQRLSLEVPIKMGDGQTEDQWYPYFFVERFADGTPDHRDYRFKHDGRWLVHVKELREDDAVFITPSRFSCLFLESTAQRFRFAPEKDTLLLDELPSLMEMWKAICSSPDMTDTKLQAIHALFESKWQAWGLDKPNADHAAFRHLVETTFKRDNVQGVTLEDVLSGRFRRCIDLYLHILKRRVSDEKKKEEHHERQSI